VEEGEAAGTGAATESALLARLYDGYRAAKPIGRSVGALTIPLLSEQTMTAGSVLLGYDRVADLLGLAGFPEGQVMLWVSVLDSYALGAALDLAAPDEVWRAGNGDTPALDAALRAAPQGRARADAAFELGLEALLAGMRDRLPGGPG
jgi:Tetracyclin repressor-like, C-terminal domain